MKKKLFYVIVCLMLAAVFTVPAFAYVMAIDTTDVIHDASDEVGGEGYLSSYTGRSYAETSTTIPGTHYDEEGICMAQNWVGVEFFINNNFKTELYNEGHQFTTAYLTYNDSGDSVQAAHYIYRNGNTYRGFTEVYP